MLVKFLQTLPCMRLKVSMLPEAYLGCVGLLTACHHIYETAEVYLGDAVTQCRLWLGKIA